MDISDKINDPAEELENETAEAAEDVSEDVETPDADEDDAVSEYNDTASQYAELEEALHEANDKYIRLFAEYDNFRKRTAKEKTGIYQDASVQCIDKLLPVIDSFERSLEADCSDENFKNGMQMIWTQMQDFLSKMNVKEVEALGAEFDPNIHNAIQQLDGTDYASNHVCQVFQKGYTVGDKLVRPAMVAVAV
ncbi:MAG TPA: nucleotide exchange factor GrpE [Ruminococcus sp.]|nr:nucleotide exchange factor GrpE [Ruminococcus sp.]